MHSGIPLLILLALALAVAPVTAGFPYTCSVDSDTDWVVAGGSGGAAVTVTVLSGSVAVPGLPVTFEISPGLGSITPATGVTDAQGHASATFMPGTVSGAATITARVESPAGEVVGTCEVGIDHAAPYRISMTAYTPEVTVGETTAVTVRLVDRYGNPVGNRRIAEMVSFTVGSAGGDAGFWNGSAYPDTLVGEVDAEGNATVTLRVSQVSGENLVFIDPPGQVPDRFLTIYGVANGVPASITHAVTPSAGSPPYQPADGTSKFTLTYTLFDRYGNPSGGQAVRITTSLSSEGERLLTTNSVGQVTIGYGPKETTGTVTITATAVANSSVTVSQPVEFTSTAPVNMLLTASPQNMPSRDVKPESEARIRAKVMDIKGNPVFGETVAFEIRAIDAGIYAQTEDPSLVSASALTNADGYADVVFCPGAFTTDRNNASYSATATGTCEIVATWGNISRTIAVTWKNYPYLSVETFTSDETVAVNDTIDVTVLLRGDGWALQPDPIDAMLVMDRSGSMERETDVTDASGHAISRLDAAKISAKTFIGSMNEDADRLGMVSYDYEGGVTLDADLGSDFAVVNASIDSLDADNGATATRAGLKSAIKHLIENPSSNPKAIRAVILMTDGNWNNAGSPVAHGTGWPAGGAYTFSNYATVLESSNYRYYTGFGGTLAGSPLSCANGEFTEQNLSIYAKNHGIRIYVIAFAFTPDNVVSTTFRSMAEHTGGFYRHAPNTQDLTDIYSEIAGELKTEAGVNTEMSVEFETVEVNGTLEAGADVFDYVYVPGSSTLIKSLNSTYTRDDTLNWANNHALSFDIGTVKLNQVWETTFRLKVLTDGNINVFGSGSTIAFNDGAEALNLPDLFITAVPGLNNTGVETMALVVDNLCCTGAEPYLDLLPVAWEVNYSGAATVSQTVSYSSDGGNTWVCFDARPAVTTHGVTPDSTVLDVRRLPPGEYLIRVHATSPDTPDARADLATPVQVGSSGQVKIQIR
ncbi:hypothetical protein ABH15_05785 [Methanoculleus taiwanensis]|uniref:VWFA domain-containing protein n=1 Tax=Methanoculleus taiwanensis TaxID=1550565 RepID=A0A498GYX1_9EURY|nr:VWA domain-containing protein [Methanoculleus taiwanensis]RXE55742.1 hypothetical protein ABH15_05785 [Methanoculleus taiwanensis]